MERLFRKHLGPGARFLDMACGTGDALAIAWLCQPQCELWGLDIDRESLAVARRRVPAAILREGDMLNPDLPKAHFDAVHEFGATFMVPNWEALAKVYLSLLRDGGILLWELPQKWSAAHISYFLSLAPKITAADTGIKRVLRSFLPSKYTFHSEGEIAKVLKSTGYGYEVLERVPIWYFYCPRYLSRVLNILWKILGDRLYDRLDKINGIVWPRYSGYYLVIRKLGSGENPC